ncbi:MAG: hypothetical protein Kow0059_17150 [Candidatus Sumerlaeia bacterium]
MQAGFLELPAPAGDRGTFNELMEMEILSIEDLLDGAQILREADFRRALAAHDWSKYQARRVLIRGCGRMIVPAWAYMAVAAQLVGRCDGIYFGEIGSPIEVWTR